jgi:hypothetical protein
MTDEVPCMCRHSQAEHFKTMSFCNACFMSSWGAEKDWKLCTKYVPDNLSYIEQEAKRRKLI